MTAGRDRMASSLEPPRPFTQFRVGDRGTLDRAVTAADVDRFADLSGDDNPLHIDDVFARRFGQRGRVVHGMLTTSFVSAAIGTVLPGPGALWLRQQLNYRSPVHVGDRLHIEVTVRHVSPATRVLVIEVRVRNQDGNVVIDGTADVQVLEEVSNVGPEPRGARTAIVTGSARGIGAAIARRLAADGVRVVVNYRRDRAGAEETLEAIEAGGGEATLVQADVTQSEEVEALVARATECYGPVEALVNNAGGPPDPRPVADLTWEAMDAHLTSHLRSAFLCVTATLPAMLDAGFGRIVSVTSQSAYGLPPPKQTGYVVAKAALAAFTRSIALETGPHGVTANSVAPGMTDTALVSDVPARAKMTIASQAPLRRLSRVEDVADVVAFLVGPGGTSVTGQTIHLSGGQVMA
ncbi:MAG TPA: SDR family oxidoreductase [Acidimicrobiales bacterium]